MISGLALLLGFEANTTGHDEKLISALGAFLGMCGVYWLSHWYLDPAATAMMVASMGASAVLLFAVPHGALSQPWPVVAGHLVSACIGVTLQKLLPGSPWAYALAVGLAVWVMGYLRCMHPPGGATALTAVMGGEQIQALGYGFIFYPVLLNVLAILTVAVLFNSLFRWRRYPVHFVSKARQPGAKTADRQIELTHEDFAAAMQQLNSLIDVTAEDLARLFELAVTHSEDNIAHPAEIGQGKYYSNGQLGQRWSVRQVIDAADAGGGFQEKIIYKTVAGAGAYETGICSQQDFRLWARFEVAPNNGHWLRVADAATAQGTAPGTAPADGP